jgi:hypothetical protein
MDKIIVTGASADLGRKSLLHLLKKKRAGELVGLVTSSASAVLQSESSAKGLNILHLLAQAGWTQSV